MKAGKVFLPLTASKIHNTTITYLCTPARVINMTMQEWKSMEKVSLKAKLIVWITTNNTRGFYEKSPAYPVAKLELLETLLMFYDM